ncbi:MAG: hypothetical protein QM689_08190 [Oscillospiraceae bacterium]
MKKSYEAPTLDITAFLLEETIADESGPNGFTIFDDDNDDGDTGNGWGGLG